MSAHEVITLKGIEEALGNLDYRNENALKSRLVGTIRGFYGDHGGLESMDPIPPEELIASLWGVRDDPEVLRNKRKNLSSIKSSVNVDLRRLYREGRNPEGIVIGPENFFVISDEAKDELLRSFRARTEGTGTASLGEIREVLAILNGILSGSSAPEKHEIGGNGDFQAIRDLVKSLSEKVGIDKSFPGKDGPHASPGGIGKEMGGKVLLDHEDMDGEGQTGLDHEASQAAAMTGIGEGQGLGSDPSVVQSDEAVEGFLEGAEYEDVESVEADEDLDEIEVSDSEDEGAGGGGAVTGQAGILAAPGGEAHQAGSVAAIEVEEMKEAEALEEQAEPEIVEEAEVSEEPEDVLEEVEGPEKLEDALDEVEVEEIDGEVVDLSGEEVPGDMGLGQGLGTDSPGVESSEVVEGFLEGEQFEDLETVEEEEDLDEIEVSDMETEDEDLSGPEVYTDAEELLSPGDLSPGLGEREVSEGLDPGEGLQEDARGTDVPGGEVAPQESAGGDSQPDGEPGAVPSEGDSGGPDAGGSGESTQSPVLDEGVPSSPEKARVLAEAFNRSLAAMDCFYNQHLLIPAGEYLVGSRTPSRGDRYEERVRLETFYIGKFPVTNALFEVFVEKTGYRTTAERCGHGTVYAGRCVRRVDERTGQATLMWNSALVSRVVQGVCWYQPSGPGSNLHNKRNHPVVQVSLEDALAFAAWTGKRLPTEEEWEAASRTARGYRCPWGDDSRPEACNLETSYLGDTSTVDQYLVFENEYGIVDAVGNVHEWTSERGGSPEAEQEKKACFIVKGGSWVSGAEVSLWSRMELERDSHSNILGFRCVAY